MHQAPNLLVIMDTKAETIKMRFLIQRVHGLATNWSPDSHQNLSKTQICTDQAFKYKVKMQMDGNFLGISQTELFTSCHKMCSSSILLHYTSNHSMHQSETYISLTRLSFNPHIYTITKTKISLKLASLLSKCNTISLIQRHQISWISAMTS